ncbi:MAG: type 4a pilus biogenesis protein PilO [Candidatus Ratteibacteria bacterium]|jgi:Tfp pilus assembly protein PilO
MNLHLSGREKRTSIATAAVIGAALLYNFVIGPLTGYWKLLGKETNKNYLELQKLRRALEMKDSVDKIYEDNKNQISLQGSDEQEIATVLTELESSSKSIGLDITTIEPLPVEDKGFCKKYSTRIEAIGEMATMGSFISAVENSTLLFNIERLQIQATREQNIVKSSFLISRILVK